MNCTHSRTSFGPDKPFDGPVYTPGVTEEHRKAHGNISYIETCLDCGVVRSINQNQGCEFSKWGPR